MLFNKLFSKKNKFQEGMVAGSKPFKEKFRKQEDAIERVGKDVKNKLDDISTVTDIIIDELSAKQKKEIYDLNTKFDIAKALNRNEKEFLASVLITIANSIENTNEYQKDFIRSILKYINVLNPQSSVDVSSIENIENINVQKAILQTIMEFLFLENENHNYINECKELFSYFSINKKTFSEIITNIDNVYRATGCSGISEKYGFVAEDVVIEMLEKIDFDKEYWENYLNKLHPYCDKGYDNGYYENSKYIKCGYDMIKNRIYYLEEIRTSYSSINVIKSRLFDGSDETIILEDIGLVFISSFMIAAINNYLIVHNGGWAEPVCYVTNTDDENIYIIENCKIIHHSTDEYMLFSTTHYNYPSKCSGAYDSSISLMKYVYKTNNIELIDEYVRTYGDFSNYYNDRNSFAFYNNKIYYFTFSMNGYDSSYTLKSLELNDSKNKLSEVKQLPTFDSSPTSAYFKADNGYLYYIINDSLNKQQSYMLTSVKK